MSCSKLWVACAVLGIWLSGVVSVARAGQEAQYETSVDVFRIQLALAGPDGEFASGLRAGDLELLVDGVPRPILDLVEIDAAKVPSAKGFMLSAVNAEAPAEKPEVTTLRPVPGGGTSAAARRRFLIFIDYSRFDTGAVRYARRAATEFLDDIAQPGDLVGFADYDPRFGMRYRVPFTTEREQIRELVSGIHTNRVAMTGTQERLDITLATLRSEAELAENVELLEEYERTRAEINGNNLMLVIGDLADALATVQGRKHVLFFSSGLPDWLMASSGVQQDLMSSVETALGADVVFHTFEPRALPVSNVHDVRNMGSTWRPASARGLWETSFEVIKDRSFAHFLAAETGGTAAFFRHTLRPALESMESLSRNFYVLAFRLQPEDGEEITVEIRPRTPSVTVTWAPQRISLPDTAGPSDIGSQIRLADALEIGNDATAMTFDLLAVRLSTRDGFGRIGLVVEIPAAQLRALIEERGDDELALEFTGLVLTPWGQLADYFRGTVRLANAAARLADLAAPLRYQNVLTAPPGKYFVKILVREAKVSRLASRSLSLEVPSAEAVLLSVAKPLVLAPPDGAPLVQGIDPDNPPAHRAGRPLQAPFTILGRTLVPSARPTARGGDPFDVLISVHHPTRHPFTGKTSLAAEAWLESDDGTRFELPHQHVLMAEEPAAEEPARLLVRLATGPDLPAGTYQLHVKISDAISALEAQSSSPLTVTTATSGQPDDLLRGASRQEP